MRLARRLYLYFIAAVSLTMLAIGVANLLELLFVQIHSAFSSADVITRSSDEIRRTLSIHTALVIVALPIWLLHWWFIERALLDRDAKRASDERRSDLRALYITAALAIPFIFFTVNATNLLQRAFAELLGSESQQYYGSGVESWLAVTLVTGGIWAYHAWLRVRDTRATRMVGASDWLPRIYLFVAAAVGILLVAFALGEILALAVESVTGDARSILSSRWWQPPMAEALGRLVMGLLIWISHWGYAERLAERDDWQGEAARDSAIRRAFLYVIALVGVFASLLLLSTALDAIFSELLNVTDAGESFGFRLFDPLARAVPFAAFWYVHRRYVLIEQQRAVERTRQAAIRRLYFYLIAFASLVVAAVGIAGTIAVSLDVLLDGGTSLSIPRDPWRDDISNFSAIAIVGSLTFLWHWYQIQRHLAAEPDAERNSTVRRTYLFATIAGSVVALVVALSVVIYRLLAAILGVESAGLRSDLSTPLATFLIAGGILVYHGVILRDDFAARTSEESRERSVNVSITGPPDMDEDMIIQTIESGLPTGFSIKRVK